MTMELAPRLTVLLALLLAGAVSSAAHGAPPSKKVVLKNLGHEEIYLRFGTLVKEIKPKKAAALTPNQYPLMLEYYSGSEDLGWQTHTIVKAGIYGFRKKWGDWTLEELDDTVREPKRQTPLARATHVVDKTYRLLRDEQDREQLRLLLIRAQDDDGLTRLDSWLDQARIPEAYKKELRASFQELARVGTPDLKEIDTTQDQEWEQVRADPIDRISAPEWGGLDGDYTAVDTKELEDSVGLEELGLGMNSDLDAVDFGLDDEIDMTGDIDDPGVGIDSRQYDLDDF